MPFDGGAFRDFREHQLGMSGYKVANALGVTPQTIYNWERDRTEPSMHMLDAIHGLSYQQGITEVPTFYKPPAPGGGPFAPPGL